MFRFSLALLALGLAPSLVSAEITAQAVADATWQEGTLPEGQSPITAKVQLLLDRAHISPGVIDGYDGGMTSSALSAFEAREGLPVDGKMDADVWQALGGPNASDIMMSYQITEEDLAQVSGENPDDYAEMAKEELLGFVTPAEAIAEKFHLDVDFLKLLNPESDFSAGSTIEVFDVKDRAKAEIARVEIDKKAQRLVAKTADGTIVANYPVAVGSDQTPSPSGSHEVLAVAIDPTYSYQPDVNFQQGDNDEALTIPPGPNGPVGTVWIDLSKPTYGIHGTPDPAKLFVERSHGCVRMTNWDAQELAHMVSAGTMVEFIE